MRVLIVKLAAIGDVVMALAMIGALKEKYGQDTHITWLCGITVYPLLKEIDLIDELIVVDERKLFSKSKQVQIKELLLANFKTAFRRYDKTIIANSDKRYGLLVALTLSPKVSFSNYAARVLPTNTRFQGIDYVELATGKSTINSIQYPVFKTKPLPMELNFTSKKSVILFPGGAKNTFVEQGLRRWPIEYYQALCDILLAHNYQVLICGSNGDEWVKGYFEKTDAIDLVGKTTLTQTIALAMSCNLVITHDSGPLHLCAILAKQVTIAIFGPTLASSRIMPNSKNVIVPNVSMQLCAPCYDGKFFAECQNNICMQSVSVDVVQRIALELLGTQKTQKLLGINEQ